MEVEKVQDGPLKKSEIMRFLEASKTSYKTVESILTGKQEPLFQQRSLTEIASETENRDNSSNLSSTSELVEPNVSQEENDLEIQSKQLDEQRLIEEEKLRLTEEKKKEEELIVQEKKEKEIYENGFSDGKIKAEKNAQQSLETGLLALENARKSILDLNASHFITLREQIASQILKLATERAGIEINSLPDQFITKIESLLETIGQTTKSPTIYLNQDDLNAILKSTENTEEKLGFAFQPRNDLMNGDIVIEIGSISISDTASDRTGLLNKHEMLDSETDLPKDTLDISQSDDPPKQSNDTDDEQRDQIE